MMSFSTDHINNKLDNLSLVDQSSSSSNNQPASISSTYVNHDGVNDHGINEDEDGDVDVDVDDSSLMLNASNMNNPSFIPLLQSNSNNKQMAKKSLLSSSLAGEKRSSLNHTTSINYNTIDDQPHYISSSTNHTTLTQSQSVNIDIPSTKKSSHNYTDEHPEPELLATSVGKEIDGRLLPSSSTISLLSLNYNHESQSQPQQTQPQQLLHNQKSPKILQSTFQQQQPPPQTSLQQPTTIDRKNSFSNIISRGSLTHLNQQRLQPYQRLTSPPPQSNNNNVPIPNNVTHYYPEYILSHSTAQSIPIKNNLTANPNAMVIEQPDSPNLDPTSVGGSPSRFWLSSQTPPRSLTNGQRSSSRTHLYSQQQQQVQVQPQHPSYIPLTNVDNNSNYNNTSSNIPINTNGSDSPTLDPVQTPSEDPPMTPLFLNKNISPSVAQDSYFGNYRIDEQSERDIGIDEQVLDDMLGNSTKINDYEMK